jgi:RNA polymerase sigma-70 factor, ECF subfamily
MEFGCLMKTVLARVGDKAGLGENPISHLDSVYRYSYSRLGQREEAEDIACEVVQALPNPCRRQDLKLYMLGMARRTVADRLRRRKPTASIRDRDVAPDSMVHTEDADMVGQTLEGMNTDQREALVCKYVIGMTSAEIGALTGRTAEAVDSLLQRARAAFATNWTLTTGEEISL